MNNEQMIQLLQKLRHHDLNHLQLMKLYYEIEDFAKLNVKLTEFIDDIMLEQRLFNLAIPQFTLFIIQFNDNYKNIRLTYDIQTEQINSAPIDGELTTQSEKLIRLIQQVINNETLYHVHIDLNKTNCENKGELVFKIRNLAKNKRQELKLLLEKEGLEVVIKSELTNEMTIQMIVSNDK